MQQFKRVQVIKLPTDKETNIVLNPTTNKLILTKDIGVSIHPIKDYINVGFEPQHLYIILDDEIKEGDLHITSDHSGFGFRKYKIIATTDTLLTEDKRTYISGLMDKPDILPQPSQQFIEKYIESYNKGEVITDVLVEYEDYDWDLLTSGNTTIHQRVKVNSKDNTITIKKLKDSWNREELINIIKKVYYDAEVSNCGDTVDKWIKENL